MPNPAATEDVVHEAGRAAGLNTDGLQLVSNHATAVYLLPRERIVVRARGPRTLNAAVRTVALTRWLDRCGLPVAQPVASLEPVAVDEHVLTWWVHYPQRPEWRPESGELGSILRRLHDLPPPPVSLPTYRPLASLIQTAAASTSMVAADKAWLKERIDILLEQYARLSFPLGPGGLLHGDAYPGNLLADGRLTRLGDWDEAARGPRELDLVNTYQGIRFGRREDELTRFANTYGFDPRTWNGFPVLREMRDLHTLGSFIRRADALDQNASRQLAHRIATLRAGDQLARWDSA
jgi:aminoglycoside phosphotransferase (APT) family kinase protein